MRPLALVLLYCVYVVRLSDANDFFRGAVESLPEQPSLKSSLHQHAEDLQFTSRLPLRDAVERRPDFTAAVKLQIASTKDSYYGAAGFLNDNFTQAENLFKDNMSRDKQTATRASKDKLLICYITSWSFYRRGDGKFVPEMLQSDLCTHVVYAYASLAPDTLTIKEFDKWADIENGLYQRTTSISGVKHLLGVGGWTDSTGDKFSKLVSSSVNRAKFIGEAIEFVKKHKFDGIHFDWQYPVCWQSDCKKGTLSDKDNYAQFIRELSSALKRASLTLGLSVPGYSEVTKLGYDVKVMSEYAEYLSVMAYDYHGGWESIISHPTPLMSRVGDNLPRYTIENAVKVLLDAGAAREKLILSIPFYGQTFRMTVSPLPGSPADGPGEPGEFTKQPGMLAYHEICYRVKNLRWKTSKQDNAGPYAYSGDQWVGYDDVKSIQEKVEWALKSGLGGIGAWTVDLDDFLNRCCGGPATLLRAIARALHKVNVPSVSDDCTRLPNPITPPPPVTTPHADGELPPSHIHTTTWPSWTHKPSTTQMTWWPTTPTTTKPTTTHTTTSTMKPQTTSTTQPSTIKPESDVFCISGTYKPIEGDCGAYKVCAGGTWHQQRCAPTLHWNQNIQRCDWPRDSTCKSSSPRPPPTTQRPTTTQRPSTMSTTATSTTTSKPVLTPERCESGEYYSHNNCNQFYICVNKELVVQTCAPGLGWNSKKKRCVFLADAQCSTSTSSKEHTPASIIQTSTTEKPSKESSSVDRYESCKDGEYIAHPTDCTRYRHCIWGRLKEFSCSPGLHWNQGKMTCDWPSNAKCKEGEFIDSNEIDAGDDKPTATKPTMQPTTQATTKPSTTQQSWTKPSTVATPTVTKPTTTTTTTEVIDIDSSALINSGYKLVCYFTNWAWYRPGAGKYIPEDIDHTLCTHVIYGFAVLDYDRLVIRAHDSWADFDNRFYERVISYRKHGIKVSLALGGWNDSAGDKYSRLVNNPSARAKFVETTVILLEKYGFIGLDLDWEYPKCWQVDCSKGPDSDKEGFSKLVIELATAFKRKGLLLSAAVSPNKKVIDAGYDVPVLSKYMDWIAVMTYDYHGQWDKKTGHVAPLYYHPEDDVEYFNANYTMRYWISKGASPSKLVMGIPLYGQSFTLGTQWDTPPELLAKKNETGLNVPARSGGEAGEFTRAKGFLAYYEICERIQKRGWKVQSDPLGRMGPYAYKGDQWVSYDDKAIIKRKVSFLKELNLAGGMIWALDLDDFRNRCGEGKHPLLSTIKNELIKDSKHEQLLTPSEILNRPESESSNEITSIDNSSSAHNTPKPPTMATSPPKVDQTTDISNSITTPSSSMKVVCYFTNWAWYRPGPGKYTPSDIDPELCTHIIYAFAVLDSEQLVVKPHDSWADIDNNFYSRVVALRSKGVKVSLGIGGWNDSAGDKYSRLVNSPSARAKFIKHMLIFLEKYSFVGLDLDWEYPKCWQVECHKGPDSDRSGFAALVSELRVAFNPRGLLLSAAVSPSKRVIDYGYDVPVLSENLDWVALMAYDYHGQWDKKTGHVSPLYSRPDDFDMQFNTNFSIHYWLEKGLKPSKLVVGVPFYGQSFTLSQNGVFGLNSPAPRPGEAGEFTRASGFLSFYEICERVINRGWKIVQDSKGRIGPFAYRGDQWVSFDDVNMIRTKGELFKKLGLGGTMVWALDLDDFKGQYCGCGKSPLLSTLNKAVGRHVVNDFVENCPVGGDLSTDINIDSSSEIDIADSQSVEVISNEHGTPEMPTSESIPTTVGDSVGKTCSEQFKEHENCSFFYVCNNGKFIQRNCPPGLHWNKKNSMCDWPYQAKCKDAH